MQRVKTVFLTVSLELTSSFLHVCPGEGDENDVRVGVVS